MAVLKTSLEDWPSRRVWRLKNGYQPVVRKTFFKDLKTSFLNVLKPKLDAISKTDIQVVLNSTIVGSSERPYRGWILVATRLHIRLEEESRRLVFETFMKTWKRLPTRRFEDVFSINATGIQVVLNIITVGIFGTNHLPFCPCLKRENDQGLGYVIDTLQSGPEVNRWLQSMYDTLVCLWAYMSFWHMGKDNLTYLNHQYLQLIYYEGDYLASPNSFYCLDFYNASNWTTINCNNNHVYVDIL